MKTAISIPDRVFVVADHLAHQLGMSRSELYVTALRSFLEKNQTHNITQRLNAIYRHQRATLEQGLQKLQAQSVDKETW